MLKRQPSRIPPLGEIQPKVRAALVQEQSERAARDSA
jgi:hypothetical protein